MIEAYEKIKKQMNDSIAIVAKERDKLRELQSQLEDYVDSIDRGTTDLKDGMREIEDGLDALSELL